MTSTAREHIEPLSPDLAYIDWLKSTENAGKVA
jgi:hypothetical protein